MKPLKNTLLLLCSLLMLSASCKKQSKNPIDNLPPATQTGANTFGCLVNGEVFLPKSRGIGPDGLSCEVRFKNGNYNFLLSGSDGTSTPTKMVNVYIDNILLDTEKNWVLNNDSTRLGEYFVLGGSIYLNSYKTNSSSTGRLNITNWNPSKGIVSGNFSFDAVNSMGEKVEIREGRFDVKL